MAVFSRRDYETLNNPKDLVSSDLDGDGDEDLIVVSNCRGQQCRNIFESRRE